jgi:5,10-methylenetetrahydromethanopterin reductase
VLTYDFRLPPGPRTVEYAILAEKLGFRAVWCPEVPAFGHDIWVTLARIAENTKRIKFGPSVLIPSYRHPMAQASAIATLEQIAPGRLMVGFGTGFTGRAGIGKKPRHWPACARISFRLRHCCAAALLTSTAVSPSSSRPTAGCPIVRSTCQSIWQAKAPRPARSRKRLPTA